MQIDKKHFKNWNFKFLNAEFKKNREIDWNMRKAIEWWKIEKKKKIDWKM